MTWIHKKNRRRRHDCASQLPVSVADYDDVEVGDKWKCWVCGRRWTLSFIGVDDPTRIVFAPHYAEGATIEGPDGSLYWRPFRAPFVGGI